MNKFAILAEDISDADVIAMLMRRHFVNPKLPIARKGYDGCGALCRKGARDIRSWRDRGYNRFVVCHDSDSASPAEVHERIASKIVRPSGSMDLCCIVVPVQEIEAWIIADEKAISKVIPSFRFSGHKSPETIQSPKEWLIKKSERANCKPLYSPKVFNASVSEHLRFDVVASKCPSFQAFIACLSASPSNSPRQ